jgi:hypothetical protein
VFGLQAADAPQFYYLTEKFRYDDGQRREWDFVVPTDIVPPAPHPRFRSDLASIPSLLTWLVPKDGRHTPAALLHDALVARTDGDYRHYSPQPPDGRIVDRLEADTVFRHAMRSLEVPFLRSWMMWGAVSVPTLAGKNGVNRLRWIPTLAVLLVVLGVGGMAQTVDLFDVTLLGRTVQVPWMADRPFWSELLNATAAILVATVAASALCFGRRTWKLGLVSALVIPVISVPLALCAVAYGIYLVLERLASAAVKRLGAKYPERKFAPVTPPRLPFEKG